MADDGNAMKPERRNALAGYNQELIDALMNPAPREPWAWTKDHPTLTSLLKEALTYAPLGFAGRVGPLPPMSAAAGPLVPSVMVNGKVFTRGPTHSQALEAYAETLGKPYWEVDTKGMVDGFTTSDGRFLNRQQAAKFVSPTAPIRPNDKYGLESNYGRVFGAVKDE